MVVGIDSGHADIPSWPGTRRPPEPLVPVVNAIWDSGLRVVTLADLDAYGSGVPPDRAAKVLRERGWLVPLRTRGAWRPRTWYAGKTPGFDELLARLRTRPDTPAAIAGHSAMEVRQWLKRPTEPTIGMPPHQLVPRCLQGYSLLRWTPRAPLDVIEDLPVWSPATLVGYMSAWPAKFSFEDVGEWLDLVCGAVDWDGLMAELDGRPRSVWMKAAFIVSRGDQHQMSSELLKLAPAGAGGPYKLGVPTRRWRGKSYPQFDIVDYVFVRHWEYPAAHFHRWPGQTPAADTTTSAC